MEDCELIGACGLFCGTCYHYRASFPKGEHLLKSSNPKKLNFEKFICQGCRSDKLYIHPGCSDCKIRECTDNKEILHCGLCNEFPCDRLIEFKNDGRIHHLYIFENLKELKTKGVEQWLDEQKEKWKCECKNNFSWYEEFCKNCGTKLNSYTRKKNIKKK